MTHSNTNPRSGQCAQPYYACAHPYHPGSGTHVQLYRPCYASLAWHSRQAEIGLKALCSLPRRVQSTPLSASPTCVVLVKASDSLHHQPKIWPLLLVGQCVTCFHCFVFCFYINWVRIIVKSARNSAYHLRLSSEGLGWTSTSFEIPQMTVGSVRVSSY